MARLLRSNIQDFVQEVPVGQMVQGTRFRCLPWPTPPKVLGGGKGEVKPPRTLILTGIPKEGPLIFGNPQLAPMKVSVLCFRSRGSLVCGDSHIGNLPVAGVLPRPEASKHCRLAKRSSK